MPPKNKPQHPHPVPTPSTTTPDDNSTPTTATKRKSVAFQQPPQQGDDNSTPGEPPLRRSRRTSTTTSATNPTPTTTTATASSSSSSNTNPSVKALGKRRAVSPSLDAPSADASTSTAAPTPSASLPAKRRKLAHSSSNAAVDAVAASTRSTRSSTAATTSAKTNKSRTKTPSTSTSSATAPTPTMPRKGTRAGRAAKAKARALEDEEDDAFDPATARYDDDEGEDPWADEREGGVEGDVEMKESGAKSSIESKVVGKKSKAGTGEEEATVAAAGASSAAVAVKPVEAEAGLPEEGEEGEGDGEGEDDDMSDSEDDDDEGMYGGEGEDDDEEIDEYETSLGLHGEERDPDYDSEGQDDLGLGGGAPRTFDDDGNPLSSSSQAQMDAEDSALLDALAGAARGGLGALGGASSGGGGAGAGGGAGGAGAGDGGLGGAMNAFRALHGMMSGMSTRLKSLLASLKTTSGTATAKLLALQELAELLSISTEDTLAGYFQIDAFAKELVAIVRGDSNGMSGGDDGGGGGGQGGMTVEEAIAFGLDPAEVGAGGGGDTEENDVQMMLLACRCLANLMEALPGSAHSIVYAGAVPVLCDKLKDIQYIELAEQTLSTLEKISEEVPSSIVREGGLSALLTYLDFFSFHVQRTAVTAAANCCRSLTLDSFRFVAEAIPIFNNILTFPDQRVVEQGCLAIVRIVDSYRHYPDKLEELLTPDLLKAIKALLNPDSTTVGPSTYTQSLKMLTTAAKASPAVAVNLVELGIASTLYHLLTGVSPAEWKSDEGKQVLEKDTTAEDDLLVMQNLVQRPKEQVQETLSLVCELLPPLPKDGIFDSRAFVPGKESRSRSSSKVKREEGVEAIPIKREEETPDVDAPVASGSTSAAAPVPAGDLAGDVKMEERSDDAAPTFGSTVLKDRLAAPPLGRVGSSSSSRKSRSSRTTVDKDVLLNKRLELVSPDATPARKLVLKRYFALLLPTLIDVYSASVSPQVRSKAVLGLLKMVQFCEEDSLADILHNVPFAAFISAILSSRDGASALTTNALQLVELLLVKMHDSYSYTFRREGVMHEISRLADAELLTPSSSVGSGVKSKRASPTRAADPLPSSSAPTPTSSTTPALTLAEKQAQDAITLRARHLREKYGAADSEPAVRAQSVLERITALVAHLETLTHGAVPAISSSSSSSPVSPVKAAQKSEKEAREALEEVARLFAEEKTPLSSFEMIESGLIKGLLSFATAQGEGTLSPQKRQEILAAAFMPQLLESENGTSTPAFAMLVKRLQETLSRTEEFEVVVAAQNQNDADSRRNGTTMLARQLKLRLVAEDGTDLPRSCSNIVVSIHAIATFQAFNDYLRPRILAATQASGGGGGAGASGTLSSLLAAFAAAAGAGEDEDDPDGAHIEDDEEEEEEELDEEENDALANEDADEALLASSPPSSRRRPSSSSRTEPAASGTGAGASTSAAGEASSSAADAKPKRRRSSRLSGKVDEPEAGTSQAAEESDKDAEEEEEDLPRRKAAALLAEPLVRDDPLFAGTLDPSPSVPRDERLVQLEVEEGLDAKVVAKTPDGTRVATPVPAVKPSDAAAPSSSASRPSPAPGSKPRASYAAALKAEPTDFHLQFSIGGREVGLDTTVFGAVLRHENEQPVAGRRNMWYNIYDIKYRKVDGAARPDEEDYANALGDRARREGSLFSNMPASIPADSQQSNILQLLHVLRRVSADYGETSTNGKGLADNAFVNSKLTAKLNRQLEEPMIVASACLPDWAVDLAQSFPFLFPFDTRYTFLQSTSFGYARLMQKWIGQTRSDTSRRDENLGFLGRLPRQKVRISRERILESAFKVFELYGSSRSSLEVEFFNEVGSGLGPTLEFYALVSKEFARKSLGMWREGDGTDPSEYVHNRVGLFPLPVSDWTTEAGKKALKVFRVLGQFVAKAMMDSRIIDVSFSRAFMRLVLEQDLPLTVASVKTVDPAVGKSLEHLQEYVAAKAEIEADESKSDEERKTAMDAIKIDNASVSDLLLDFTLPGYEIPLKDGGADVPLTIHNVGEYVQLVIEWTLQRGVEAQVVEFQKGFSSVFPVRDLQTFTPAELVMLTAAVEEDWSVEALTQSSKADHGFTHDSRPVRDFLSVMSELSLSERRDFLSFMTGSPRLPIGGFAALSPPLTIVRKDGGDAVLPSVMTCVNFVKLPDYTSRDVVKERILMAVREGAGGFHLS